MQRLAKILGLVVAGIVLLIVLSAGALLLFFDPNDFRDDIAAQVEKATGRELVIEGDLAVSVFPWLAVEVGRTRLGNRDGFGDAPFASFETARLSVRFMPLVLRQEIAVGTATLDLLTVNLAVDRDGRNNWDDLAAGDEAAPPAAAAEEGGGPAGLDIAGVEVRNAAVRYTDAQAGSEYRIDNLSLTTGRIAFGEPFDVDGEFDIAVPADDISGGLAVRGRVKVSEDLSALGLDDLNLSGSVTGLAVQPAEFSVATPALRIDVAASRLEPATLTFSALGVSAGADLRSLSWADAVTAEAGLDVAQFSPRDLAALLGIELPATADPGVLTQLALRTDAELDADALSLENLELNLDDTTMTGELALPVVGEEPIRFNLAADSIDADRYMAPAGETADAQASAPGDDFEIPFELIESIDARGNLRLGEALFAGMTFTNLELGLTSGGGKLRLNPVSAELFDGSYSGDIRVDASGETPTLSLNERVSGVSLTPLARAMFEQDNITGMIDGSFVLNTRGETLGIMRRNLNGNLSFELADGAWQGVDLWHQLRSARALYRREVPPEATTPAQTRFSSVLATGTVTDGVFRNEDFAAEMPFLQVTGNGTVDLVAGEVDYALRARVLERPEFLSGASDEELEEFTEALIPVRVRGPLADPSVRPDIEAMFRDEVEDALKEKGDELKKRLLDRLAPDGPLAADGDDQAAEEEKDVEDELKDRLKDLFEQ